MHFEHVMTAREKALQINLDDKIYGTFAEIGAGQEVARHFFRAGGAAGTIAKTISAYDMTISDTIYGRDQNGRYVSEGRLLKMLEREFDQLIERLVEVRPKGTRFFAFADTVAAKSYKGTGECHGWMGLRFQHAPESAPSELVIHVRMLDNQNVLQQEALGVMGVNIIHACYFETKNAEELTRSLMHGLGPQRIEIDMIRASGPAFGHMDVRLLNLELVKKKFTQAVMFDPKGMAQQPSDCLYKKNVLILRGSFRPPTLVNIDMMERGLEEFKHHLAPAEHEQIVLLPEISMSRLVERGEVDNADFLARVDLLNLLGHHVMISNKESFQALTTYIKGLTKKSLAFVSGIYNLEEIFKTEGEVPVITRLGEIFAGRTQFFIYPAERTPGHFMTALEINCDQNNKLLLNYICQQNWVCDIRNYNKKVSKIWSRTVLTMIQEGQSGWEEMLPQKVSQKVKTEKLFGLK